MPRVLASALLLLCLVASPALATEQVRERIVVDGRVHRIDVTPLEPLLKQRGERIRPGEVRSTDLYRGYVGTWLLEDDRLSLLGLIRYEDERRQGHEHPLRVEREIPLSEIFGDEPGPIAATWWTGQLRVGQGNLIRAGWRNALHARTLYLNVEKGRVSKRRLVDNLQEGRGLSPDDVQWVMRAEKPPADDGAWYDARSIGTEPFRKEVPVGTTFRTRGFLAAGHGSPPTLYVPRTPATDTVRFPLLLVPGTEELGTWPRAELEIVQVAIDGEIALRARSWRPLEPGETMHHPDFPVPPLRVHRHLRVPAADEAPDPNLGYKHRDDAQLHGVFDRVVSLRGTLSAKPFPNVHGVEVEAAPDLVGKPVLTRGLLEKWVVTKRLLEKRPAVAALFAARGEGTWHRLVHPRTGALVRPVPAE